MKLGLLFLLGSLLAVGEALLSHLHPPQLASHSRAHRYASMQSHSSERSEPLAEPMPRPRKSTKAANFHISCYGCGAEVQTDDSMVAGYIEEERYELKRLHHQLQQLLCCRCRSLSQGEILPVANLHQISTHELSASLCVCHLRLWMDGHPTRAKGLMPEMNLLHST